MPFVDAEEPDAYRAELGRRGHPECAARAEAQDTGVEVEQAAWIDRRQYHMAETLIAGDEPRPEGCDDRAVIEHRTVEHFQRRTRGVLERDHFLDPALVCLGGRQFLERNTGGVQRDLDFLQRGVVAYLPADGQYPVDVAGGHDDACRALVHPQVQRRRVGTLALGESQDTEGELTPPVHVAGRNGDVAEALDNGHQISARSGPSGSTPNELSADAW